jgi:hypothetical protein
LRQNRADDASAQQLVWREGDFLRKINDVKQRATDTHSICLEFLAYFMQFSRYAAA